MATPESRDNNLLLRERPIQEVADVLQNRLGQMLVAYAYGIGVRDPKRIC